MRLVGRILCVLILMSAGLAMSAEKVEHTLSTSIQLNDDINESKAYEIAKIKLCRKALVDSMRGENNNVFRRNWKILGAEKFVFEEPHKYFSDIIILNKKTEDNILNLKAKVVVDISALRSLMNQAASSVIDEINDVGLTILFLARASDKKIDYNEKVIQDEVVLDDEQNSEVSISKIKNVKRESQFTTRFVDSTEILTNITSRLTDSGIRLYGVQALLPYVPEGDKLENYIKDLEKNYVGYIDKSGVYRSGNIERSVAFVQKELCRMQQHPRYFALGKIDIGNTTYDKEQDLFRAVAKCTITLWDLNAGLFPVNIATTPIITGIAQTPDKKEAQKTSAENAAIEAGNQILDRIRSAMLEEVYKSGAKKSVELNIEQLSNLAKIDVDETRLNGRFQGSPEEQYQLGYEAYINENYSDALMVFMTLADQGYIKAQNMLAEMYYWGRGVENNDKEAVKWLKKGVRKGNSDSQFELALIYFTGKGIQRDYSEGLRLLNLSANQGNARAICEMGNVYFKGLGVNQNYTEALKWYRKAEKLNYPEATYRIGILYFWGNGVVESTEEAVRRFERAAEMGVAEAIANLGYMYENGWGVEKNYNKAVQYFREAKEKGYIPAIVRLAYIYQNGTGVEQNDNKAFELLTNVALPHQPKAIYALGRCYECGRGVDKNFAQALEWYRRAAEFDSDEAMVRIGLYYKYGEVVELDYKKARDWFKMAEELGNNEARIELADMYYYGVGVDIDYVEAMKWNRKAAENGSKRGQYNVGVMYARGLGVDQDYSKAADWYEKAANSGYAVAYVNLGNLYISGKGVDKDYKKALEVFNKAAKLDEPSAYTSLAFMYRDGVGVEKDAFEAVRFFEKAGELGSVDAYLQVGLMFDMGDHVRKDPYKALIYYKKAAEMNSPEAMYLLATLYRDGRGADINKEKAYDFFSRSAEAGYMPAQSMMGSIYENGMFNKKISYKKATDWYKLAAAQGDEESKRKASELKYFY